MQPNCGLLILVGSLLLQLASPTAGADPSVSEVLHSAYMTRLFALESRLKALTSRSQLTSEEQTSFSLLKTERERLSRRVKVSKHYVRKRLFDDCRRKHNHTDI